MVPLFAEYMSSGHVEYCCLIYAGHLLPFSFSINLCLAKQDKKCITYLHVFICHVIYLVKLANQ
jgi:hypothetical protein